MRGCNVLLFTKTLAKTSSLEDNFWVNVALNWLLKMIDFQDGQRCKAYISKVVTFLLKLYSDPCAFIYRVQYLRPVPFCTVCLRECTLTKVT